MKFKDKLKAQVYRWDIPLFFKEELHLTPDWEFEIIDPLAKFLKWQENLKNQRSILIAGRGSGKTIDFAGLALWSVGPLAMELNYPYKVTVLGGSQKQSNLCYDYVVDFLDNSDWLSSLISGDILRTEAKFVTGGKIMPVAAGPKSVRGIHPDALFLDEGAEIERKVVQAALPTISTSAYPRLIWGSTPHVPDCYLIDILPRAEELGYKFFSWTSLDVPWTNKTTIGQNKLEWSKERWETEYLAKPAMFMETLIPNDDFKRCIIEKASFDPTYPTLGGCDWGEVFSAFLVLQRQGKFSYVLKSKEWHRTKLLTIEEEIKRLNEKFEIDTIYADASHPGMNERLINAGVHVKPIHITKDKKPMLQDNIKWRCERGTVKIPKENERLLKELSTYTSSTKKNDHLVDALMLALDGEKSLPSYSQEKGEIPAAFHLGQKKRKEVSPKWGRLVGMRS